MFSSGNLQWFIIIQIRVEDEYDKIIPILKSSSFYLYVNSLLPKKNQSLVTFGGLEKIPFCIWGSQFLLLVFANSLHPLIWNRDPDFQEVYFYQVENHWTLPQHYIIWLTAYDNIFWLISWRTVHM